MKLMEMKAKMLLDIADDLYRVGAEGQKTTEEDSVTVEADIRDRTGGVRHVKVVITERSEKNDSNGV